MSTRLRRGLPWLATLLLVVLIIVAWEVLVRALDVSTLILPPPSMIADRLGDMLRESDTWHHTLVTTVETVVGFGIAVVSGVAVGVLIGKVAWLETTLRPIIVAIQVVPKVALVPLFVIWFGFGMTSKIVVAAILAFFPIMLNVLLGVKSLDQGHRDVMRSLNASRVQTFLDLEVRSVMPYLLAGMETGIVFATIGAIVGEYLGGSDGLGFMVVTTLNQFDAPGLFGVIVILSVLGLVLYALVYSLKRLLIPWHESVYSQGLDR